MAEGNVVDAALASIRVLDGARGRDVRRIPFQAGWPARVVVGSDVGATLRIEQADVAPRQLDVIWDGGQLWLQDALRLGRTFVNGRLLNEWVSVRHHAVVCCGSARLWLTSRAGPTRRIAPDFAALERARQSEAHHSERVRLSDTCRFTVPSDLLATLNEQGAP